MAPTTVATARAAAAHRGGILVLTWLALTLAAAPAGAQYPPEPEIAVGTPGAVILIEGTDWGPGTDVTVTYRNPSGQAQTASTTAEPDGGFSVAVAVPADAEPGPLPLTVSGTGTDGAPKEWTPNVLVVPEGAAAADVAAGDAAAAEERPGAVTPAGALPTTGTRSLAVLAGAAALLAVGTAALYTARARSGRR